MKQDIRTLLLCKSKAIDSHFFSNLFESNPHMSESPNKFITIGNYDALMIYDTTLFNKNASPNNEKDLPILESIEEEKKILSISYLKFKEKQSEIFYYPMHIVCYKNKKDIDDFWSIDENCLVTLLIYGKGSKYNLIDLENLVDQAIAQECPNYLIYRSLNLSELVVIFKYSSLKKILDTIAILNYKYPSLQTYTICGFRCLLEPTPRINYVKNQIGQTDIIPMLKITGTINSYESASKRFECISQILEKKYNNHPYMAFGNNDFNLIFTEVKTLKIVELINSWIQQSDDINHIFANLKTRAHVQYDPRPPMIKAVKLPSKNIQQKIETIGIRILNIFEKIQNFPEWIYPFIETINGLSNLFHNPSLSHIKYCNIIDSLLIFTQTLEEMLKDSPNDVIEKFRHSEQKFSLYTSALNTLIESTIRIDGHLSQELINSPIIYNIMPSTILEYYCFYLLKLTDIITKFSASNTTDIYNYSSIPLLGLGKDIAFINVINHPLHDEHKINQVNVIEIPYNKLYQPEQLLFSTTHEVMHFCGENFRCREIRGQCFIKFLSAYIVHEFDLDFIFNDAFSYVFQYFSAYFNLCKTSDNDLKYFDTLLDIARSATCAIYADEGLKSKLRALIVKALAKESTKHSVLTYTNWINICCQHAHLYNMLDSISYLFKECYADMMTILFLDIPCQTYCKIIDSLNTPSSLNRNCEEKIIPDIQLELRKALVIHTIHKDDKLENDAEIKYGKYVKLMLEIFEKEELQEDYEDTKSELLNFIINKMCKSDERYPNDDLELHHFLFDEKCLTFISDYLNCCNLSFKNCVNHKSPEDAKHNLLKELQDMYAVGIDQSKLLNDHYCKLLYENRKSIDRKIDIST